MLCRYTLVPGIGSALSPETTKVAASATVATVRQLELEIDPPKKILFPFFLLRKKTKLVFFVRQQIYWSFSSNEVEQPSVVNSSTRRLVD